MDEILLSFFLELYNIKTYESQVFLIGSVFDFRGFRKN